MRATENYGLNRHKEPLPAENQVRRTNNGHILWKVYIYQQNCKTKLANQKQRLKAFAIARMMMMHE